MRGRGAGAWARMNSRSGAASSANRPPPHATMRRSAISGIVAGADRSAPNDSTEMTIPTALTPSFVRRMGTVYAIANQKGGVGKTTTAVNLGACAAGGGHRTLLVDMDPQCNATVGLGLAKDLQPNIYDCLAGDAQLAEAAKPTAVRDLEVVPATPDLAGANVELPRLPGSETRLRDALGDVRERYRLTLLDCPPALGPRTVNALVAADRVIVPVQAEYYALEGMAGLLDTVSLIQREVNPRLTVAGMVIT